ncbi:MAG: outer membrane beta-barrel protein [Pseudomonadota bacterium]
MNNTLYSVLALAALLATSAAHAEQEKFYVGVAVANGGKVAIDLMDAGRVENTNHPLSFDLSGGYDITPNFAIEAGYARHGKFEFGPNAALNLHAVHVAAKASMALGSSFSLYAKVGLNRQSVAASVSGVGVVDSFTKTRPLLGIGAAYHLPANFDLTLGLTDYGTVKSEGSKLTNRKLEAGLNYHF